MLNDSHKRYLRILGFSAPPVGLSGLKELVFRQVCRVPFENVSKLLLFGREHRGRVTLLNEYLDGIENLDLGGTCYTANPYFAELLQACDRLIGRQTTNEEVFKLKGDVFMQLGQQGGPEKAPDLYRQAVQCYSEALTRRVNYPEAFLARGHVQYEQAKFAEAVSDWEKALALGAPRSDALTKKLAEATGRE